MLRITIRFDGQEYRIPGIAIHCTRPEKFDFARDERQACYTDDKVDAIDTARYVFGKDVKINFRRVACADPRFE